jgi:hypothetical protein
MIAVRPPADFKRSDWRANERKPQAGAGGLKEEMSWVGLDAPTVPQRARCCIKNPLRRAAIVFSSRNLFASRVSACHRVCRSSVRSLFRFPRAAGRTTPSNADLSQFPALKIFARRPRSRTTLDCYDYRGSRSPIEQTIIRGGLLGWWEDRLSFRRAILNTILHSD